jgi:DNA processing protein
MEDLKYWIWLSKIGKLGSIKTQKLLEKYHHPKEIWKCKKEDLLKVEGIGEIIAEEILNPVYRENLDKIEETMKKEKIELISLQDKAYPENLKELYDKPISLYVKGNKEILKEISLAMIGCRENSIYGKQVATAIAKGLAKQRIITVSGLARGIDSISHIATLQASGKTIAVIGSGLDKIYPYENTNLAEEIVKTGGAIVSEYPLGTKAEKMNFPARNRIISGLSSGVIVIEAKKKSGTMTTVDFALEQGKTVFAIPRKYK